MNLKKQLLLVSLFMLLLPWAGCQFIRETESALRSGQQQLLAGTARAQAATMAQYAEEYPEPVREGHREEQLFLHALLKEPHVDGYVDDWLLSPEALRTLRGAEGPIRIALASYSGSVYLYIEVTDRNVVYANAETLILDDGPRYADRVSLISSSPPYRVERFNFAAEAPGPIVSYRQGSYGFEPEPAITAHWQDVPGGYRIEARIPADLLAGNLGLIISNTSDSFEAPTRVASFGQREPPPVVRLSSELQSVAASLVEPGTRLIITDTAGWRIASAGKLREIAQDSSFRAGWTRRIYNLLVEPGEAAASAEPDPAGRELQPYVNAALQGRDMASWFRGESSGGAIVAVAAPIVSNNEIIGALILQQSTAAILSLTNEGLSRLINLTLIATLLVAAILIGYASWLSRRIRRLSVAAEDALENGTLRTALPSALAGDEVGDLSRSFSHVLRQLGDYNAYLRTLASKLSHELRTPLAIVTSSLENLEHEPLNEASAGYTTRAREGADRLRRILSAMSEASRVEELMEHAGKEVFDLHSVLTSTIEAYRDVYPERCFEFNSAAERSAISGSPELVIQMLDKLIDNAVDFSASGDTIRMELDSDAASLRLTIINPGPPLPESMRTQLFDSMVSVRGDDDSRHLGLGLYVARLIATGHGGSISADNIDGGVAFSVLLPLQDSR